MNIVVLQGTLSRDPATRDLPSGDRLASFEVTVREGSAPAESVPVVWFDPPDRALTLASGASVTVRGRVRRRFFRTPVGTGSRTEVVADAVLPTTQQKRVRGLLREASGVLTADEP